MPGDRRKTQKAKSKTLEGFTLIEFVVVLGILSFAVGSTLLFLNSVLKSANQTNVSQEVKQNGQAILDSLDRQIRGAVDAEVFGPSLIKLSRLNEDPLYIKCLSATATQNDRIGTAVSVSAPATDSDYTSVSNDNRVRGVNITNCSFSVVSATVTSQGVQSPAVVTVSFDVDQGLDAPDRQDFASSASFSTTISLRTY